MKTVGQIMLADVLPEDLKHYADKTLDKKRTKQLFKELAEKHPDQYNKVLSDVGQMSFRVVSDYGRQASPGLDDMQPPEAVQQEVNKIRNHVDKIKQSPDLSSDEKKEKVTQYVMSKEDDLKQKLLEEGTKEGNAFVLGTRYGWKANPDQVTQLLIGDLLTRDVYGQPTSVPGLHGYAEGLSSEEQMAAAPGSMGAMASVQESTRDSGFLSKQLAQTVGDEKVTGEDCGTEYGVVGDTSDPDNFGRVLQEDTNGVPAGTVVDENAAKKLQGKKALMRNPITCSQRFGLCSRCVGKTEEGRFPRVGEHIGITTGAAVSEPIVQAGLSSKHSGKVVGSELDMTPFEEINQMYQVSQSFKGAELSPEEGKVTSIKEAPQGGKYVKVNEQETYVSPDKEILVSEGEDVEQGDRLTEGDVNPKEYAKYKGLGEGRRKFAEQQYNVFRKHGLDITPRQSEILAKGFINHAKITDPEGIGDLPPGKVVTFSELQDVYKPRERSVRRQPETAKHKYLEEPVLHYSVGTKITPRIARDLKQNWNREITVHDQPPGFEPVVQRASNVASISSDWKTRLSGFGIHESFKDAAQKGSTSPRKNQGYISELMNPLGMRHKLLNKDSQEEDVPGNTPEKGLISSLRDKWTHAKDMYTDINEFLEYVPDEQKNQVMSQIQDLSQKGLNNEHVQSTLQSLKSFMTEQGIDYNQAGDYLSMIKEYTDAAKNEGMNDEDIGEAITKVVSNPISREKFMGIQNERKKLQEKKSSGLDKGLKGVSRVSSPFTSIPIQGVTRAAEQQVSKPEYLVKVVNALAENPDAAVAAGLPAMKTVNAVKDLNPVKWALAKQTGSKKPLGQLERIPGVKNLASKAPWLRRAVGAASVPLGVYAMQQTGSAVMDRVYGSDVTSRRKQEFWNKLKDHATSGRMKAPSTLAQDFVGGSSKSHQVPDQGNQLSFPNYFDADTWRGVYRDQKEILQEGESKKSSIQELRNKQKQK